MSQHMDFVFDSGAYGAFKPMGLLLGAQKAVGPYRIPHTLQEERMVYTNKVPCGHMRAPGYPQGVFASESQMDVVAGELGMDPVEFRRINLMRAGDESPFGKRAPHLEAARVLDRALQDSRYHSPKPVHTGRGVAMAQWVPPRRRMLRLRHGGRGRRRDGGGGGGGSGIGSPYGHAAGRGRGARR